jgi:hypothetical protein
VSAGATGPATKRISWTDGRVAPERLLSFAGETWGGVYEYDAGTQTWRHHGAALPAILNTLALVTPGREYWLVGE